MYVSDHPNSAVSARATGNGATHRLVVKSQSLSEKACISYSSRAARTQTIGSAISLSTFLETVASSMFVLSWIHSLRERIVYAVYSDFAAVRSGSRS